MNQFYEIETVEQVSQGRAATVRIRYKEPAGETSQFIERDFLLDDAVPSFGQASQAFRFAAAVTEYAEVLRLSKHSTGARFDDILSIAQETSGGLADREEFRDLVLEACDLYP